jgi:hypothetical protein
LLLVAAMPVLFYYPVLFQQQTQIHAEGVSLGIALMHMLSSALQGDASLLWTTSIYGGHPIFAEGQGGFANPLHLLLAWLLSPVAAYNINQFLCMVLGAGGAYGLCRSYGCRPAAATFASLALAFSTLWIGGVNNLAVASTMAWIPWVIWAMNSWLQRADLRSACLFGASIALMVLSGYPQLVHGVLIYLSVYLAVQVLQPRERKSLWEQRRQLLPSLSTAIALAVGLSAIQWLPLLELARESHRSGGIGIIPQDNSTIAAFLRGFLFTFTNPEVRPDISAGSGTVYFTAAGSLLVCMVFSLFVFFRPTARMNGHLLATLVLLVLGLGRGGTPVFQILYDWHLIPGLRNFRVSFTYLFVALVGITLVSGMCLEALARLQLADRRLSWRSRWPGLLLLAAWLLGWLGAVVLLHVEAVSSGQYYLAALWLLLVGIALARDWQRLLPVAAVLLLCLEIVVYRIDSFDFGAAALISKPASIQALEEESDLRDFKFADRTFVRTYALLHPKSPEVVEGLQTLLQAVSPAANALWGAASISGNLALGQQRHVLAEQLLGAELTAGQDRVAGLRLLDYAAVKYLTVGRHFAEPGFENAFVDEALQVRIVENLAVHPRFQFFDRAIFVSTAEEAAATLGRLTGNALVIEAPGGAIQAQLSQLPAGEQQLGLLRDRSDHYELAIHTTTPVWFYLADANYPGWNAYLDGARVEVYSAQLMGKAIFLPAGEHLLELVFEPLSFRLGLAISLLSCCALLVLALRPARSPRSGSAGRAGTDIQAQ